MKRWLVRITLVLFLGVMTTIGVAWGLLLRGIDWSKRQPLEWPYSDEIRNALDAAFGPTEWSEVLLADSFAWDVRSPGVVAELRGYYPDTSFGNPPVLVGHISRISAGWPMAAAYDVQGRLWRDPEELELTFAGIVIDDAQGSGGYPPTPPRVLPTRPIWSGLIIDTLFYAALWCAFLFGLSTARRSVRRRRGQCVKCGYDLRGEVESGCPECGWKLEQRL